MKSIYVGEYSVSKFLSENMEIRFYKCNFEYRSYIITVYKTLNVCVTWFLNVSLEIFIL